MHNVCISTNRSPTIQEVQHIKMICLSNPYYFNLYVMPFIIIVGYFGNPISFLVWFSKKIRRNNSSACYMSLLALNDLMANIFSTIYHLWDTWAIPIIDFPIICQTFIYFYYFFQYFSLMLAFAFTFERWIAVCYPFKREKYCNERRAWLSSLLIAIALLLILSPNIYLFSSNGHCSLQNVDLKLYIYLFTNEIIVSAIFPLLTLIFNFLVILEMNRISRSETHLQSTASRTKNGNDYSTNELIDGGDTRISKQSPNTFRSTTITLLLVSFFYILTTLPMGTIYAIQQYYPSGHPNFYTVQSIKSYIDIFSTTHFSFNFFIYYFSSEQFRNETKKIIKKFISHLTCNKIYKRNHLNPSTMRLSRGSHDSGIPIKSKRSYGNNDKTTRKCSNLKSITNNDTKFTILS